MHKISIIPRGRALGYTLTLPTEDKFLVTRSELVDELAMLLGGRTAEELIFADPTTGAQNDIDRATTIARQMVTEFGMSDALGPMRFGHPQGEVFLGRDFTSTPDYSDEVAAQHRRRGAPAHRRRARRPRGRCSTENREVLDRLAAELDRARDARSRAGAGAVRATCSMWDATLGSVRRARQRRPRATVPAPSRGAAAARRRPTSHTGRARVTDASPLHPMPDADAAPSPIEADRGRGARDPRGDRRGPRPRRAGPHARRASPTCTTRSSPGLHEDPSQHLTVTFEADHDEMVMVRDIPVHSMCEHHLVPFAGRAHVAYIPGDDGRITGLSKIARLVDGFAKRPQVQERLTTQIADALVEVLEPNGVLVMIEAEHFCMSMRGVKKPGRSRSRRRCGASSRPTPPPGPRP